MSDEFIVVETVSGRGMAEVLRSFLQAQGVQCELSQEALGIVYGMTVGALGSVDLLVPSRQGKQARELLKDYHRSNKKTGK
jgi:hypothetical protein